MALVQRTAQGHITITRQRNGQDGADGKDGTSVLAQFSANKTSWHMAFQTGDVWMRVSTDSGRIWGEAMRIVGEQGTNGSYIEYSFAISADLETANVTTPPTIQGSWADAPLSVTDAYPYLWCRMIAVAQDGKRGVARYVRITGEKGDAGTTIAIKGSVPSEEFLRQLEGMAVGDAYVVEDTGHLWVYTGEGWSDVGQFKGETGAKAYLHIAYANSADGSVDFTTDDTEADGHTYIGTYTDNIEADSDTASDYHWMKIKGEQGEPGEPGSSVVALDLKSKPSYTMSTWKGLVDSKGASTWTGVNNAAEVKVGDIGMVSGTVSDKNNINITYLGTITSIQGTTVKTIARSITVDGEQGPPGDDGNGTVETVIKYVATDKKAGVEEGNTTGWGLLFPEATAAKPYVWKWTRVTYSKSPTKDIYELIAVYQSGANANLLDDTSFSSDYALEAWDLRGYYSVKSGQTAPADADSGVGVSTTQQLHGYNSYYDETAYCGRRINYKEILRQVLKGGGVEKLSPNTQYTLSFWAKGWHDNMSIVTESSNYGFAQRELYLTAGVTYTIRVCAKTDTDALNAGETLAVYIYRLQSDGVTWVDNDGASTTFSSTSLVVKTMEFTPKTTGTYYIKSFHGKSGTTPVGSSTVQYYAIEDTTFLQTAIISSCIDTNKKVYIDGLEQTVNTYGTVTWALTTGWKKHTFTFTTKTSLSSSAYQHCLFRMLPSLAEGQRHYCYLCMPKLEVGMFDTTYTDSSKSLQGAQLRVTEWEPAKEYQAGKIGEKYHDVVMYEEGFYDCISSHISKEGTTPDNDGAHWKEGDKRNLIATKVLLADMAKIAGWTFHNNRLESEDGNTYLDGVNGTMRMKGTLQLSTGYDGNISDVNLFYMPLSTTSRYLGMGYEKSDIGKVVRFFNSNPWGGATHTIAANRFSDINNTYLYDVPIAPQETLEMTCFEMLPEAGEEYRAIWTPTNRFGAEDFRASGVTGRYPRMLALGRLLAGTSPSLGGRFYDGRLLSEVFTVTRVSTGVYTITFNEPTKIPSGYMVMCTGCNADNAKGVINRVTNGFQIMVSNNSGYIDSSQEFMILDPKWWYNMQQ